MGEYVRLGSLSVEVGAQDREGVVGGKSEICGGTGKICRNRSLKTQEATQEIQSDLSEFLFADFGQRLLRQRFWLFPERSTGMENMLYHLILELGWI